MRASQADAGHHRSLILAEVWTGMAVLVAAVIALLGKAPRRRNTPCPAPPNTVDARTRGAMWGVGVVAAGSRARSRDEVCVQKKLLNCPLARLWRTGMGAAVAATGDPSPSRQPLLSSTTIYAAEYPDLGRQGVAPPAFVHDGCAQRETARTAASPRACRVHVARGAFLSSPWSGVSLTVRVGCLVACGGVRW